VYSMSVAEGHFLNLTLNFVHHIRVVLDGTRGRVSCGEDVQPTHVCTLILIPLAYWCKPGKICTYIYTRVRWQTREGGGMEEKGKHMKK